jgi:hypothetical protein
MRRSSLRTLFASSLALASSGCWPGWQQIFDVTPSRESFIEDMRVLAVAAEPAALVVPGRFLDSGTDGVLTLEVTPFVVDPRPGEVNVSFGLCATTDAFAPCQSNSRFRRPARAVSTDADDPIGRAKVSTTFELTPDDVRALYDQAGVIPGDLETVLVQVLVDATRTVNGKPERESASISIPMQLDPLSLPDAESDALLDMWGLADCGEAGPGDDFCHVAPDPNAPPPECGNGIIEGNEQCDPPDDETCDLGCFVFDPCLTPPAPLGDICFVPLENARPALLGMQVVQDVSQIGLDERIDVEPNGTLRIPRGRQTLLVPLYDPLTANEAYQTVGPAFPECPAEDGSFDSVVQASCPVLELLQARVYVKDGALQLTNVGGDEEPLTGFTNPLFDFSAVGLSFKDGTAAGTREPLVVVVADGRGGMDAQLITVEAE